MSMIFLTFLEYLCLILYDGVEIVNPYIHLKVYALKCSCGGECKYYDTVKRYFITQGGKRKIAYVERVRCCLCGRIRRILPDYILPYKHYEADIVYGVVEGLITSSTLGYEECPSECTMKRWIKTLA